MKHILLCLVFSFGVFITNLSAIDASVSYAKFKGEEQNYVELYLFFIGGSVHYKTIDNAPKAAIETVVLFKQEDKIIKYDKFTLNSPPLKMDSTGVMVFDFADLKRYALENGKYKMEVTLTDLHSELEDKERSYSFDIEMKYEDEKVSLSDLQPVSKYIQVKADEKNLFAKNGFMFETHPFGFYAQQEKVLKFYVELYNSNVIADMFYVRYFIKEEGADDEMKPLQMRAKKLEPKPVHAMILQLGITTIPSGNYELVFEVRNRNHEVLSKKSIKFQRSNPFLNNKVKDYVNADYKNTFVADLKDPQIQYSLRALAPRMENLEVELHNNVLKSKDYELKRKYLFNYWVSKDPQTPKEAFTEYMREAQDVDKEFRSSMGLGFETDRGYIYLKYGKPNDLIKQTSDPTAPPYEIWEYYELNGQQNVKFVFANPTLAVNDFKMIHSTLRGELSNPNWQRDLYENAPIKSGNYIDNPQVGDQFGRNAGRIFDQ
jgi:GWxTD domain-containing protein